MKKLLLAAVAVATLASPAFAQTANHHHDRNAYGAYAAQNGYTTDGYAQVRVGSRSGAVYDTRGRYIGSDPDATVRNQLSHDPTQGD
jgi:opacity protein-like surface antigen